MIKGIDISHHNGTIDWRKVKASGIDFAIIRAGYAQTVDSKFTANVTNALRAGIHCGAYWFSYACTPAEAIAEAKTFLKTVKPFRMEYPLAYDYEYDSVEYYEKRMNPPSYKGERKTVTAELASDMADAFMSEIAHAGYYIVNYTNNDYLARYFTYAKLKQYEVWLAKWTTNKPINVTGLWQNAVSPKGTVSGINTEIDMDISYKDYPVIIRNAKLNHLTDNPKVIVPQTYQFKKGDIVKVLKPVIYGTSRRFIQYFREYDVLSDQVNDRVVIGKRGNITTAIEAINIAKIR